MLRNMYILCTFCLGVCYFVTLNSLMVVFDAPDPESDVRFLLTETNTEIPLQYPKVCIFQKIELEVPRPSLWGFSMPLIPNPMSDFC